MLRITSWVGVILLTALALPSPARAQNIPNPSCAKANSDFACVGALDGTTLQQIIVGSWNPTSSSGQSTTAGYIIILENTGVVRKVICVNETAGACPTVTVQQ
jgi:hypothetical protein